MVKCLTNQLCHDSLQKLFSSLFPLSEHLSERGGLAVCSSLFYFFSSEIIMLGMLVSLIVELWIKWFCPNLCLYSLSMLTTLWHGFHKFTDFFKNRHTLPRTATVKLASVWDDLILVSCGASQFCWLWIWETSSASSLSIVFIFVNNHICSPPTTFFHVEDFQSL